MKSTVFDNSIQVIKNELIKIKNEIVDNDDYKVSKLVISLEKSKLISNKKLKKEIMNNLIESLLEKAFDSESEPDSGSE